MKTFLPTLLAISFCALSCFAADKPKATASASAASGTAGSLVEVGKTYAFHGGSTDIDSARVIKIVNDNWIEVQYGEAKVLVNLQHLDYISEIAAPAPAAKE